MWPPHVHHGIAQDWFKGARGGGWATCPITQLGCIRILATPAISLGTLTIQSGARLLAEILSDSDHRFWPDDLPLADSRVAASLPHVLGPGQLTDCYLLALAAAHGGTLATFDQAIGSGLPTESELLRHLEIIAR